MLAVSIQSRGLTRRFYEAGFFFATILQSVKPSLFMSFAYSPKRLLADARHTDPGNFGADVAGATVTRLGPGPLPVPEPQTTHRLTTGVEDGQWVSIDGCRALGTRSLRASC